MQPRSLIWIAVAVGSTLGGLIPSLWGADLFSFSSMLWSGLGAFAGIWAGYRLSQYY